MIRALPIIVFGILLIAAVLTPPIFSALEYFMSEMSWPYSRVYGRIAMLVLLGFIVLQGFTRLWPTFLQRSGAA